MKRTKILATYGPAIANEKMLTKLVDAGVNAFRVNCSHGTTEDFSGAVRLIRKATNKNRFPVGILFDISGPKLRLDRFAGEFPAKAGEKITLINRQIESRQTRDRGESSGDNRVDKTRRTDLYR